MAAAPQATGQPAVNQAWQGAYPPGLQQAEFQLIALRRGEPAGPAPLPVPADRVGIAFSGGGIRSATFGLGVLQSLARAGLLRRFDHLSTVSGGGYVGSFLTQLLARDYVQDIDDAQRRLRSDAAPPPAGQPDPIAWLRQNSRYLAPTGGGDLLLDVAVIVRNWIALQIVLLTFFLMCLVGLQGLRVLVDLELESLLDALGPVAALLQPALGLHDRLTALCQGHIQWSPWIDLLLPWFLYVMVPLGWAYWLIGYLNGPERPRNQAAGGQAMRTRWIFELHPLWGVLGVILVGLGVRRWVDPGNGAAQGVAALGLLEAALVLVVYGYELLRYAPVDKTAGSARRLWRALRDVGDALLPFNPDKTDLRLQMDARARNSVSQGLAMSLALFLALAFAAVIDSLGQTLYVLWWQNVTAPIHLGVAFAAVLGLATRLGSAGGIVRRYAARLGSGVATAVLSGLAAWALILVLFSGIDALAHAVAWQLKRPPGDTPAAPYSATVQLSSSTRVDLRSGDVTAPAQSVSLAPVPLPPRWQLRHDNPDDALQCGAVFALLLLFSLLFGRAWPFLNRSSQHPLYRDRLTRAYLGASNARRSEAGKSAITDAIPGDDALCPDCWAPPVFAKGAPLHLINVTINETTSTRGKTTFRDRKGIGLAIGPAGLSAGVRHHARFSRSAGGIVDDGQMQPLRPPGGWSMFGNDDAPKAPERLSLGQWMAISGAAFSTGMGQHTSFALSVLTGFANVRLGYWWDSGVKPARGSRSAGRRFGRLFHNGFPLQAYLMSEFTAAFHGPDEPHWYLSDGGAFENMGGYELIRRRLPLMVIVDGEEDPDYTRQGLANLVRKARMDFGAEIRFLDAGQLGLLNLPPAVAGCFGEPEQLHPDADGYSGAHAALATIRYDGAAQAQSLILYLKPTLKRDSPLDVREYQVRNPPFPQQPTFNQFFDEAQWESYRRLGEYIADKLFADGAAGNGKTAWLPRSLKLPPAYLLD